MNDQFSGEIAEHQVENGKFIRIAGQACEPQSAGREHAVGDCDFVMKFNRRRNRDPLCRRKVFQQVLREQDTDRFGAVVESGKIIVERVEAFYLLKPCDVMKQRAERGEKTGIAVEPFPVGDEPGKPDHIERVIQFALHGVDQRTVRRAVSIHIAAETVCIIGKGHFAYSTERVSRMMETLI